MSILDRFRKKKEVDKKKIRLEKLKMRGFTQRNEDEVMKKEDILGFWCHTCDKNITKRDIRKHLKNKHKVFLAKFGEETKIIHVLDNDKKQEFLKIEEVALRKHKKKTKMKKEKVTPVKYILELYLKE
ncbi:MAG: hypothetical protein ABIE55_03655 [Candidatus Aenigmatarchaeota archaeon]